MSDTNFKVKNTLTVNTNFVANGSQVSIGANVVFTNNQVLVGNSTSNVTIANTGVTSPFYGGAGIMPTANSYWANTAGLVVTTDKLNAVGVYTVLTDAASIVWDHALGLNFSVTIGASRTLAFPSNPVIGRSGTLLVRQNGTGGFTLSYAANIVFDTDTAPVIGVGANKYTLLFWHYIDATHLLITMAAKK